MIRCKIVRFQRLMWRNMMRSTKSQKVYVLHYNIDITITEVLTNSPFHNKKRSTDYPHLICT